MDRTSDLPAPAHWNANRDQIVVLRDVPWDQYEALLRTRGEAPQPRIAYLDGELELVTTSEPHEFVKKLLARLVELYALERKISLNGFGNATRRKKARQAGAEPDEWYRIGRGAWAPDLAIEVVHTSGGVDKLEIYRRLGVGEVWFWVDKRIHVFRLVRRHYEPAEASTVLPGIDVSEIARIVARTDIENQTEAVYEYQRSLKRRRRATGRAASRRRR